MFLYGIRHKPSGNFLPEVAKQRGGYSWTEPTPATQALPRLWHNPAHARLALGAWLKGRWKQEAFCSSYESQYPDDVELTITPVPERNADDMEIVLFSLTVSGVMN